MKHRSTKRTPIEVRFMRKVIVRGLDKCWGWRGAKSSGYPVLHFGGSADRMRRAHRLAWEIFIGPIPAGLFVCHHCDNRGCSNPLHLFVGDNAMNVADMMKKGRGVIPRLNGESHPMAKLKVRHVRKVRRLHAAGIKTRSIADALGISLGHVRQIVSRQIWRSLCT